MKALLPVAGTVLAALSFVPAAAQCQWQPQAGLPVQVPQGHATATVNWDPDGTGPLPTVLVAGGSLTVGSMLGASVVTWDGTHWSQLGTAQDEVTALTVFQGQLLAAFRGSVSTVARWDGSGWVVLGTVNGGSSLVNAFALFQNALVVAGSFTSVEGVTANNIVQWTGAAWGALGSGVTGEVKALAVNTIQPTLGSGLYVGGSLTAAGGSTVYNLATWDGATWRGPARIHGTVHTLASRVGTTALNSYVFVGGSFGYVGQAPSLLTTPSVARYQPVTDTWSAMSSFFQSGNVQRLFVRGTGISGYEVIASGSPVAAVACRWDGTTWQPLGPTGPTQNVATSLGYFGGRYIAGGYSPSVQSFDGTAWSPLADPTPGFAGRVLAVLDDGNGVIAAGSGLSIGGLPMHGIMRGAGASWAAMGGVAGPNGTVHALARLPNGDVIAAGDFTVAGGGAADRLARWNGSSWTPIGGGTDGPVYVLLPLPDGGFVAGGAFLAAGSVNVNYLARWTGSSWTSFGQGTDGIVRALARLPNGDLVAGGDFTRAGGPGNLVGHVARWDGSWHGLGTGTNGPVNELAAAADGSVLASGSFTIAGNVLADHAARWNGSVWTAPYGAQSSWMRDPVVLPDGDVVYHDGTFVLRWSSSGVTMVQAANGGPIACLALAGNGDLLLGGEFLGVPPVTSHGVARSTATCPAAAVAYGSGCSGSMGPVVMTPVQLPWLGGAFRAETSGIAGSAIAFDLLGFASTSIPLGAVHPSGAGCSVLVAQPVVQLLLPAQGRVVSQFALPNAPVFLGAVLYDQVVQLELGAGGGLSGISSSNGLQLTIGRL